MNLYWVAMKTCHDAGFDWQDPRTGKKYKAPIGVKKVCKKVRKTQRANED